VATIAIILVIASVFSLFLITNTNTVSTTDPNQSTLTSSRPFTSAFTSSSETTSTTTYDVYLSNWLTYHETYWRGGFEANGPTEFSSARESWVSSNLDGVIYAEPLVFNNTVYVATEGDSVYALNEANGDVLWKTNLGSPVPASTMGVSISCWTIDPLGVTSTPAIDPTTGTIYAVGMIEPGQFYLFALNVKNGDLLWSRNVDPQGMNPLTQQQRPALALANGYVYIGFGGNGGDCGAYNGYLVAARENNDGPLLSYEVPTSNGGPVWGPSGPAIDNAGDLYISTGNSNSTSTFDYGNAVIKLSPVLQVLGYFAPSDWITLNEHDLDLGSVGPTILNNDTIFQIGKEGVGYLLNSNDLGGIGGQEYSGDVCYQGQWNGGSFGGIAYDPPYLYVPCIYTGIIALKVNFGLKPSFSVLWNSSAFFAGAPIVADGAIWTVNILNLGNDGILYALNPANGSILFSADIGSVGHFISPSADRNLVFIGGNQSVWAFSVS
jgi:polyvinyl alcohol dehydrogenase (cytochrome)